MLHVGEYTIHGSSWILWIWCKIFHWHEANLNIYSMMFQPGDRAVGNLFQAALGNDGNDFVMWIWLVKHVEGSVCFFSADCSSRSKVVCSELILLSAWIRAAMPSRRVRAEWLLDHCRGLVGSCSFPFQSTEGTRSYSSYFKWAAFFSRKIQFIQSMSCEVLA